MKHFHYHDVVPGYCIYLIGKVWQLALTILARKENADWCEIIHIYNHVDSVFLPHFMPTIQ